MRGENKSCGVWYMWGFFRCATPILMRFKVFLVGHTKGNIQKWDVE